jgi:uncharacterized protein YhfF
MNEDTAWWQDLPRTRFGSARTEERLAALIIAGRKRATVWNALQGCETAPGMQWVVTVSGRPVAVIETLSVEQRRFDCIDEAFAREEGEGDRSLTFWQSVHEDFFQSEGKFARDMMLWCEHFRLIEVLDPDLAACADQHVALEQAEGEALVAAMAHEVPRESPP